MKKYKFYSYYKYQFLYKSDHGEVLVVGEGNSDDIYRCNLLSEMTREALEKEACVTTLKP